MKSSIRSKLTVGGMILGAAMWVLWALLAAGLPLYVMYLIIVALKKYLGS